MSSRNFISLRNQLHFMMLCGIFLLALYSFLRLMLLIHNHELMGNFPASTFIEAFINGFRFDLRLVVIGLLPLLFAILSKRLMAQRRWQIIWLSLFISTTVFLAIVELDFYQEFHQRLNALVFQYMAEDPKTVISMLWYGFPVMRYLLMWLLASGLLLLLLLKLHQHSLSTESHVRHDSFGLRLGVFIACFLLATAGARGTLRQGPPLRWGDASTTESVFANQLGLNGVLTLADAARARWSSHRDHQWQATMPNEQALERVRNDFLTANDQLVDSDIAALRRISSPVLDTQLPIRNIVVILMESFAGHYVGALGANGNITPNFDRLAKEGLLFTRYFSNGTHTHQGMFATMACFPNLPGFEYLMQIPEGAYDFSGLPQLLSERGLDDLYVYNGDFAWDNQRGFFGAQGMRHFIGRNDFINPVFSDPTWGVSDQDMFDRAAEELQNMGREQPFYALLQTLSNHTPYALPDPLPVEPVNQGNTSLDKHLTAMRYSDWALGQFFEKAKQSTYYDETLFVIVGDHGFGGLEQLSELDLYRFHVPMLLIGPGVQTRFGNKNDIVGTQLDVVPTIMGRLGVEVQHQCWGRDLLALDSADQGHGVIKPSGSDQTVGLLSGEKLLVLERDGTSKLYQYKLHSDEGIVPLRNDGLQQNLLSELQAFLQVATNSLVENTSGAYN